MKEKMKENRFLTIKDLYNDAIQACYKMNIAKLAKQYSLSTGRKREEKEKLFNEAEANYNNVVKEFVSISQNNEPIKSNLAHRLGKLNILAKPNVQEASEKILLENVFGLYNQTSIKRS